MGCGTTNEINLHSCIGRTEVSKLCYFDWDDLLCKEVNLMKASG